MSEVVVVAIFRARPGRADDVEAALQDAIVRTHAEPGCIRYALHRTAGGGDELVFVERWESREALGGHAQQPHITALRDALADLVTAPAEIHVLEPRPAGDVEKGRL